MFYKPDILHRFINKFELIYVFFSHISKHYEFFVPINEYMYVFAL